PLVLEVADTATAPHRSGRTAGTHDADPPALFVEAEVDDGSPYVNGEIRYTVRVYDGVGMLEGALSEPAGEDLRVTPVGETRRFETEIDGRRYRVHERQYTIAPLRSGRVEIGS